MNLTAYRGRLPRLNGQVFIAAGVQLIGDVVIGDRSSVWYNAVLRGDLAPIVIGTETNLQDGVIAHVNTGQPLVIGNRVSVGHSAIVHGCTIADGCLIGMGAIVLNGVKLANHVLVGAGSLLTENKSFPEYTLVMGSPAKVVRELTDHDIARMKRTAKNYVEQSKEFYDAIGGGATGNEVQ